MSTITTQRTDTMARKLSEEDIRALAFDLYTKEGGGDPVKHWLKAEEILKRRYAEASTPHTYAPTKPDCEVGYLPLLAAAAPRCAVAGTGRLPCVDEQAMDGSLCKVVRQAGPVV